MQTSLQKLQAIIERNYTPELQESAELQQLWPATVNPAAAARGLTAGDNPIAAGLRRKIAMRLGDRDALYRILGEAGNDFDNFYPDPRHKSPSTADTIDAFLGKFSRNDPGQETSALEKMIFSPQPPADYAAALLADGENPKPVAEHPEPPAEREKPVDKPELSMSLAQILIKNRNYSKALEIIEAISLTNPKKSIYFADQIRFLRKLIINDNKS